MVETSSTGKVTCVREVTWWDTTAGGNVVVTGPADPGGEPSEAAGCPTASDTGTASEPTNCRAREVLQRVGDKWSMYAIDLLGQGTMRFTELHRSIDGITARMLT